MNGKVDARRDKRTKREARTERLDVRYTPSEKERIEEMLDELGLRGKVSLSEVQRAAMGLIIEDDEERMAALDYLRYDPDPEYLKELNRFRTELVRVGTNLNQLMRRINGNMERSAIELIDFMPVKRQVAETLEVLKKIESGLYEVKT